MIADARRCRLQELISQTDWPRYDYTTADAADLLFPDYPEAPHERPVWLSKHCNRTANMSSRFVCDLNDIAKGSERRLMALYGEPVEWTGESGPECPARIVQLDQAKAADPALFAQWLDYYGLVNEEHLELMRARVVNRGQVPMIATAATAGVFNITGRTIEGHPPLPFASWIEVCVALAACPERNQDSNVALAGFGLTSKAWASIGHWWGHHFNANANELMPSYRKAMTHFQKLYRSARSTSAEQVIVHVAELATTGKASQILEVLAMAFPEGEGNHTVLDGRLQEACARLAKVGDRQAAERVFRLRYPLQEPPMVPLEEWIQDEWDAIY